jgi:MoaA/NifB/PqqE/SkfB family radical SAM enzyme
MKRHIDCLTIMLTNQCPLRCAHCGPRSGPGERGALGLELIISTLDEARERLCRVVNFSGGEPFILGDSLIDFVKAAAERSMIPRITTGAYWSNSAAAAKRRLEPLVAAGLRQLVVSSSDAHREFVPMGNVIEAARAARHYGIELYLALGTSKTSKTCSRTIREAFEAAGESPPWLYESPYIPFGRASDQVPAAELILQPVEKFAGACPSLTVNPTIHADGNVTGCAVVFGRECPPLTYGNVHDTSLGEILDLMNSDPLAAWIHKIGVVELKQFIEDNSSIRFDEHYVNICHLCGTMMNSPETLEFLESVGLRSNEAIAT